MTKHPTCPTCKLLQTPAEFMADEQGRKDAVIWRRIEEDRQPKVNVNEAV